MQPSKEQIENAARLVPEYVEYDPMTRCYYLLKPYPDRLWQPTADTEAGSADWAVLDTAVMKWLSDPKHAKLACGIKVVPLLEAIPSGDLNKRKAATFAAAAAIGAHMKEVEGE